MPKISYIDEYYQEVHCSYNEEKYSVRDNGSILKHSRIGKKPRPTDNNWTFGKFNTKTGYLEIASVRVHRIVATAFHGEPPTKEYVVDHIDTNKQNNRPENLRWVTRLENILLNPITVKRIEFVCGCSVEEFLANPSYYKDKFQEPNFQWMCTVSKEEAQLSLERLLSWAKSDKLPTGGSLGEWVFNRGIFHYEPTPEVLEDTKSKTPNAVQRDWKVPCEFPCCPQQYAEPIREYAEKLERGSIFCQNDVYSSLVVQRVISEDGHSIYLIAESTMGESAIKPWAVAKIIYENSMFVHINLGSFFTQVGAEKIYCIGQGLEWNGEESIDDYC